MTGFAKLTVAFVLAATLAGGPVFAQEEGGQKQDAQSANDEMYQASQEMMAWMQAGTPGPEHENLEYMIGNWDVQSKMYMLPDTEPMEATATSESKWVLDGRMIRSTFKGDFGGMPFEGVAYSGYDKIRKKYVSTWMDCMSTWFMFDQGTYDPASKSFEFNNEMPGPDGGTIKNRTEIKVISKDRHEMRMYTQKPGKDKYELTMELVYTRAKPDQEKNETGAKTDEAKTTKDPK